jgi:hypothetical protein
MTRSKQPVRGLWGVMSGLVLIAACGGAEAGRRGGETGRDSEVVVVTSAALIPRCSGRDKPMPLFVDDEALDIASRFERCPLHVLSDGGTDDATDRKIVLDRGATRRVRSGA